MKQRVKQSVVALVGGLMLALSLPGVPASAEEVPYVPTPPNVVDAMLSIAQVEAAALDEDFGSPISQGAYHRLGRISI